MRVDRSGGACPFCASSRGRLGTRGGLLAASLTGLLTVAAPIEALAQSNDSPVPAANADAPLAPEPITAIPIYGVAPPPAEPPEWTITVDPLTTALGFVHVQVERALGERWSIYAGPHLRLFSSPLTREDGEVDDLEGYGAELGVRFFVWGDAPQGAWLMVRGAGGYGTTGDDAGFVGYLSHLLGYTWIWDDWLVLAGGAGIQYLSYEVAGQGPDRGMAPALHTNLGVAF